MDARLIGTGVAIVAVALAGYVTAGCSSAPEAQPTFTATTAPPPPPPQPVPIVLRRIDDVLSSLPVGSVAFNTPKTIQLGDATEIELLLSPNETVDELKKKIDQAGDRLGARVRITNDMQAHLAGPDFDVTPITEERQAIAWDESTRWVWEIVPRKTGTRRLHLTLTGFFTIDGERTPRTIETFSRTMKIDVTWPRRVSGFVEDNWQWLWTVLFAPALVALWRRRKRRDEPRSVLN